MATAIMVFTRDPRTADNPALAAPAVREQRGYPLPIVDHRAAAAACRARQRPA